MSTVVKESKIIATFPEYQLARQGSHSESSRIIKQFRASAPFFPTLHTLVQYQRSVRQLKNSRILKPIQTGENETGPFIQFEQFEGYLLKQFLDPFFYDFKTFLDLATRLTRFVKSCHDSGWIIGRLSPLAILVSPKQNDMKLIYHGHPQTFPYASEEIDYIAPEHRNSVQPTPTPQGDFFGLGMIFYELLTRSKPLFGGSDRPRLHFEATRVLPDEIKQIVHKLVLPEPQMRYQSTSQILQDLEGCKKVFANHTPIPQPNLATDKPITYLFEDHLYGREPQVQFLNDLADQADRGETVFATLVGYSGIGKTSLVNQVFNHRKGWFITGKFDQVINQPYLALIDAFQQLAHQLLALPTAQQELIREAIEAKIGNNLGELVAFAPKLAGFLGPHLTTVKSEDDHATLRLHRTVSLFIEAIAEFDGPLVLFIDDMHWADPSSLSLVKYLLVEQPPKNLLLISAYRQRACPPTHPLRGLLTDLKTIAYPVHHIELDGLGLADVQGLIQKIVDGPVGQQLAKLIHKKTMGNPFFIKQMLITLKDRKQLVYNQVDQQWIWKTPEQNRLDVSDNVGTIMAERFDTLPSRTREILSIAACLGNTFELNRLAEALATFPMIVSLDLWHAEDKDFIIQVSDPDIDQKDTLTQTNCVYKFSHDKIQKAAYSQLTPLQQKETHLMIARRLFNSHNAAHKDTESRILTITNHYNKALDLITKRDEQLRVAQLNLEASRHCSQGSLINLHTYYRNGTTMLTESDWTEHYSLMFDLSVGLAEVEFKKGNRDAAAKLFKTILKNVKNFRDRVLVYRLKVNLHVSYGQAEHATMLGIRALKGLHLNLSSHPSPFRLALLRAEVRFRLSQTSVEELTQLPTVKDAKIQDIMALLSNTIVAAYMVNKQIFHYLALSLLRLTLTHGKTIEAPISLITYGILLGDHNQDYKSAVRYGEIALNLCKKNTSAAVKTQVYLVLGSMLYPWVLPPSAAVDMLEKALKNAVESGDLMKGFMAASVLWKTQISKGDNLIFVYHNFLKQFELVRQSHYFSMRQYHFALHYFCKNLIDNFETLYQLESPFAGDDIDFMLGLNAPEYKLPYEWFLGLQVHIYFLFGRLDDAHKSQRKLDLLGQNSTGQIILADQAFYRTLLLCDAYRKKGWSDRLKLGRQIRQILRYFKKLSTTAPRNFSHKYWFLIAEYKRAQKRSSQTVEELYLKSIELSTEHGFAQDTGLFHERLGQHWLELNQAEKGYPPLLKARDYYLRWGATKKVNQIEKKYGLATYT